MKGDDHGTLLCLHNSPPGLQFTSGITHVHNPALLRQLPVLHVNLLERLDVLADKADRHRQQALDALAA